MSGPKAKPFEPEEENLTEGIFRQRLTGAFDNAVKDLTRAYSAKPPQQDLNRLNALAQDYLRQGKDGPTAVDLALRDFMNDNPDALITRYANAAKSKGEIPTDWIVNPVRGTISFNAKQLASDITIALSGLKTSVVGNVSKLCDRDMSSISIPTSSIESSVVGDLQAALAKHLGKAPNNLPVTVGKDDENLIFVSQLSGKKQSMKFSDSER